MHSLKCSALTQPSNHSKAKMGTSLQTFVKQTWTTIYVCKTRCLLWPNSHRVQPSTSILLMTQHYYPCSITVSTNLYLSSESTLPVNSTKLCLKSLTKTKLLANTTFKLQNQQQLWFNYLSQSSYKTSIQ